MDFIATAPQSIIATGRRVVYNKIQCNGGLIVCIWGAGERLPISASPSINSFQRVLCELMATIKKEIDQEIVKIFFEHKAELYEKFQVESLAVFGSVSRGSATSDSDIDILVKYQKTPGFFAFLQLKQYLENIVGRPVDLVTEGALKKRLRDQIMKEAIRVA